MKDFLKLLLDEHIEINERIDIFYENIDDLVKKGYDRNGIHKFVNSILNGFYSELPEELSDAIYEFKTSLIGDAAPSSIFRFKGDPKDDEELAQYVRSYIWMKDKD